MSKESWTEVDSYIIDRALADDPVLAAVAETNAAAGLPAIDVSPPHGKLLHLLARMSGARRVLEIGTLGGYSTIWLARALPSDGIVVTFEVDPRHADVARRNFESAGVASQIDLRVGAALETLQTLLAEGTAPFDFVFIDADKANNPNYLAAGIELSRPGAVIICDNVVRDGKVVDAASKDPDIVGTRKLFDKLAEQGRFDATAIQTVGSKGWDGFVIGIVT